MVEWHISDSPVPYEDALVEMETRVEGILAGTHSELIWLLEHPPLYTAGTSAKPEDLINAQLPVHQTRRGGQYTYHGPGQRVVYVMLDLDKRGRDVRRFVSRLEDWVIATLADFQIAAGRREGRIGVWVDRPEKPRGVDGAVAEDKIAAIGVRIRKWVSFHGISINVEPELSHYDGIIPCGIAEHGVTSMVDLGLPVTLEDLDLALTANFGAVFETLGHVTES